MRLDVLLKSLCLVKTRSLAASGIEKGAVKVNGRGVKPSRKASEGDIIEIRYPDRILVVELTGIPAGQVARKERSGYFRIIREAPVDDGGGGWNA